MAVLRNQPGAKPAAKSDSAPPIKIVFWQDVIVVSDNGRASTGHYRMLSDLVLERGKGYPGLGMLSIIARDATPPGDDARRAMNEAIARVAGCLKCICWLVEGDGFQGAMVRAVLTGIRLFGKQSYPTHVTSEMVEGLSWVLQKIDDGPQRLAQVDGGVTEIQRKRMSGKFDKAF